MPNKKKNITVAFTGHRTYRGEAAEPLAEALRELYSEGYRVFLCGMAWGFDLAAAEAVIALRSEYDDVELVAVVPHATFGDMFRGEQKHLYDNVLSKAQRSIVLMQQEGDLAYIRRNDYLVDNASYVLAWWDGKPTGGTAYTVAKARREHLPVRNLYPQLQLDLFK
ncbi:MAG: DUF1273 family protein [Alistipes sp.]|nr:DUF1273 family protein [Alistipes sp.]